MSEQSDPTVAAGEAPPVTGEAPSSASPPPAGPPPSGPPPSGPQAPWAAQFGLVRPRHGRYLAGVCAAIGRATKTDPLLWRVLIGVLAIFGVGIVIYLAGWLLMPAEGDSASPVEAVFGRGHSSTSSTLTLIIAVIVVVLTGAITDSFFVALLAGAGIVVAALVVNRNQSAQAPTPVWYSPPPGGQAPQPPPQPYPAGYPPNVAAATSPREGSMTSPIDLGSVPPPGVAGTTEPAGYRPPFAPYGPYQTTPPPPPPVPVAAKPAPEPSRLGRLIFSVGLLALGGLGMIDLLGASIPGVAYIATALAVTGLGLIVGAWFGRARGYIALGIILSLILPMGVAGENFDDVRNGSGGRVFFEPTSVVELQEDYRHRFGEATLDLRQLDLAGSDKTINVRISMGEFVVLVPQNADVTVITNVSFGNADIFEHNVSGVGVDNTYFSPGPEDKDGGQLLINLDVSFGHAEVTR